MWSLLFKGDWKFGKKSSPSSSSDFGLTCRYRGNIHISGPPSRLLACCTHGRCHIRSPVMSIMRVDSWELPLCAIPLCQLLPCHLGPPRPMLSINLYVKGCLDCYTAPLESSTWAFSPSEWGPNPQCQDAQVAHWVWWWQCLAAWHCRCKPWWLSWMRHPTGNQEVTGSTPAEVGNILSWRLIMKYFLQSFSPFRWFKKGSFWQKNVHNTG